jgi:hypothetical protein
MSKISEVGAHADSNIATVPPPALIERPHLRPAKKASGAKSEKAPKKEKLTPAQDEELTAKAKDALAALDAHGNDYLSKMLAFGEVAHQAKASKPHGEFQKWCEKHLSRSPSWVSNYRRLFEERAYLPEALKWASEAKHKWAYCRSVERLLKVIAEFKAKDSDAVNDNRTAPTPPRKAKEVIAELHRRVEKAEEENVLLVELLPSNIMMQARILASKSATGDAKAKADLAAFARACRSRLLGSPPDADQTSSALEVSELEPTSGDHNPDIEEKDATVGANVVSGHNVAEDASTKRDLIKSTASTRPEATILLKTNANRVTETGVPVESLGRRKMH